ncbi:MAG: DUF4199 domain-containing protein [Chitinophagales bacterium]
MGEHIKTALRWGVIGGMGMAILRFVVYFISPDSVGAWENAYYVPLLFCMVWAAVTVKKEEGGNLRFGRGYAVVFTVALVGVIINTGAAFLLIKVIDTDMADRALRLALEKIDENGEKYGSTPQQLEQSKLWTLWFFKSPYAPLAIFAYQVVVGAIISLLVAAFTRRNAPPQPENENPEGS